MEKKWYKNQNIYLVIILVVQVLLLIYWGNEKSNYYWDEYFSFDNAHYYSSSTPRRVKLDDSDLYKTDTWIAATDLKDTYIVTKDISILNDSPSYVIKKFLSYKPYMGILNIVETVFFEGEMSKWSGISLNIVIFVIGQILLYCLVNEITKQKDIALLSVIAYGFSGMAISMVEFVRMYMWISTAVIIVTYIHFKMWIKDTWMRNLLLELLSVIIIYIAYLDSPLMILYAAGLIGLFCLALLSKKRYLQFLYYFVPLGVGGFLYLFFCTNYIQALFQQDKYLNAETTAVSIQALLLNMVNIDINEIGNRISYLWNLYGDYLFGSIMILSAWIVLIFILFIQVIRRYSVKELLVVSEEKQFLYIWEGAVIGFLVLSIYVGSTLTRYNSPVFSSVASCFIIFSVLLGKKLKKEKQIKCIIGVFLMVAMLLTNFVPKIENIYREDKEVIQRVASLPYDSIVWNSGLTVLSDCISWMDEEKRVYITNSDSINEMQLPSKFLFWSEAELEEEMIMNLEEQGKCEIEKIGKTYISNIYYCDREMKK